MRGFLFGLVLLPALAIAILSIRPGGLRRQLRFAARRLRLALILAGVYLFASTLVRVLLPGREIVEDGLIALAAVLALAFVILGQDPRPAGSASAGRRGEPPPRPGPG